MNLINSILPYSSHISSLNSKNDKVNLIENVKILLIIMAQRAIEAATTANLSPTEEALYHLITTQPGRLVTPDQLSKELGREIGSMDSMRHHVGGIRTKTDGKVPVVTLSNAGVFLPSTPPETLADNVPTLPDIGVSPFTDPPEEELMTVPGLSVLSPAVDSPEIIELMNGLKLVQPSKGEPYLRPEVGPPKRSLIAQLAKEEKVHSREELLAATGVDSPNCLSVHIRGSRGLLNPRGFEIYHRRGSGWLLAPRPPDGENFIHLEQTGNAELDLLERIMKLQASPETTQLISPPLEKEVGGENVQLPIHSQLSVELLTYCAERPNQCLDKATVFREVMGSELDYKSNSRLLTSMLYLSRRILRREAPEENWQLASVINRGKVILYQGKPGDIIRLPGLADLSGFNPKMAQALSEIIEQGVLQNNSTVKPALTLKETEFLLALAKKHRKLASFSYLARLWADRDFYDSRDKKTKQNIRSLASRLSRKLSEQIVIRSIENRGYILTILNLKSQVDQTPLSP
jgi:DNA-binding response OmpR family regulator